jgi:hypothetical protein
LPFSNELVKEIIIEPYIPALHGCYKESDGLFCGGTGNVSKVSHYVEKCI